MVELLSTANLKRDIPSGLVVFLVALPLCLGISLASGAPFFSGLISGIIGGLVIGFLSTSHLSVSGPAAGLAALVLAAISNVGSFNLFLCSVVIAGVLQIGMGFLRLGGIAEFFPSSVIKGMLTSIGILIIAKQIPHAVGYDRDEKGSLSQLLPFGNEDWHELLKPFHHIEVGVALLCVVSIVIIVLWELPAVKQKVKVMPGALVAVVVSVLLNELFTMSGSFLSVLPEHLVQIQSASSVSEFLSFFTFPDVNGFTNGTVLVTGVMIAVIASLETLLSVEAVDNLDPKRRVTNTNKELVAQGIGNVVSGLIGGLPITSVIVRSSANINAGAVSKFSAMFHGILLLLSVIAIPFLLNRIPLAALAAILLVTGYKLCRFSIFTQMLQSGKSQSIPFFQPLVLLLVLIYLVCILRSEGRDSL